jgi:hypothetical protein
MKKEPSKTPSIPWGVQLNPKTKSRVTDGKRRGNEKKNEVGVICKYSNLQIR